MLQSSIREKEGKREEASAQVLDRSENGLKSIEEIRSLLNRGLTQLKLSLNQLNSVGGLPMGLTILDLSSNRFENMRSFVGMNSLKQLDLSLNMIQSTDGIDLCNLETLNISNNVLVNLKGLDKCRNLRTLNIRRNKLKTISFSAGSSTVSYKT
jgi:hypothetical protein